MADDDGFGSAGLHLEEYSYLGAGTVVIRNRPQAGKLSYYDSGAGGDPYTGLDRFGRVKDQNWVGIDGSTSTDRFKYGYDRNSNVLYKENMVEDTLSEIYHAEGDYGYDKLNRLTGFSRGKLEANKYDIDGDTSRTQAWELDALGNWDSIDEGTDSLTGAIARDHNHLNQITDADASDTVSGMAYDDNGNMLVDEEGNKYIYDGWNRLVEVTDDGDQTLITYRYDALGRRIVEQPDGEDAVDLYYSSMWQVLEEHVDGDVYAQNVWSPVYIDALVLRDRDADTGTSDGAVDYSLTYNTGFYNLGTGVVEQPDGKVLIVGSTGGDVVVLRYDGDSLDTSFDSDGVVTLDFATSAYSYAVTLLLQPDGKIIVVGGAGGSFGVARLNADGSFDTSFSSDGKMTTTVGSGSGAYNAALAPDGDIYVVGNAFTGGDDSDTAVARINPDGTLDSGFGAGGKVIYDAGDNNDEYDWDAAYAVVVQPDGKPVVAGYNNFGEGVIVRFETDGDLDTSFSGDGIDLRSSVRFAGLALQPDGMILAVGSTLGGDAIVYRYESDGTLDTSFGSSGSYTFDFGTVAGESIGATVAVQADGKILLGGSFAPTASAFLFSAARLTAAGALDTTFDTDGRLTTNVATGSDHAIDGVIANDGDWLLAGISGDDLALVRYEKVTGLEKRVYAQQDANYNVTALVDVNGAVVERFLYDPYGAVTFLDGNFDVDVNGTDYDWVWLFQGGRRDGVTLDVHFRNRDLDTKLGRWTTQDPAGTTDGLNLYESLGSNPSGRIDPNGTFWSLAINVAFAASDTAQWYTGKISGREYSFRMALNVSAIILDVVAGGGFTGAGTAMQTGARAAVIATRVAKCQAGIGTAMNAGVRLAAALSTAMSQNSGGGGGGGGGATSPKRGTYKSAGKKLKPHEQRYGTSDRSEHPSIPRLFSPPTARKT